jgi:hypothetical protein
VTSPALFFGDGELARERALNKACLLCYLAPIHIDLTVAKYGDTKEAWKGSNGVSLARAPSTWLLPDSSLSWILGDPGTGIVPSGILAGGTAKVSLGLRD